MKKLLTILTFSIVVLFLTINVSAQKRSHSCSGGPKTGQIKGYTPKSGKSVRSYNRNGGRKYSAIYPQSFYSRRRVSG